MDPMAKTRPLTNAAREQLSDARLLLESASHNCQAALKQTDDVDHAIANAEEMATQALAALRRLKETRP
jgi:hypothetical protein